MKHAAIGVRMHSGWGALVVVSNSAGTVEVIDRRRVAVTTPGTPGANQPYHFAENLDLPEAEKFLGSCFAASKRLALDADPGLRRRTASQSIHSLTFSPHPAL